MVDLGVFGPRSFTTRGKNVLPSLSKLKHAPRARVRTRLVPHLEGVLDQTHRRRRLAPLPREAFTVPVLGQVAVEVSRRREHRFAGRAQRPLGGHALRGHQEVVRVGPGRCGQAHARWLSLDTDTSTVPPWRVSPSWLFASFVQLGQAGE